MGWRGFNCSIPNKVEVMKYLDRIGESAQIIGAVNTVIISPDGKTTGENTDGKGFVKAISEVTPIAGRKTVIFGAGGAARAIAVEMALAGVQEIIIVNRSESGKSLTDLLNSRTPAKALFQPWNQTFSIPSPVGLYPNVEQLLNIRADTLLPQMIVADCIPNPVYTPLLKEALANGCRQVLPGMNMLVYQRVLPGMNMLVYQAMIAIKYWTGKEVDADIMKQEMARVLGISKQ